MGAIERAEITPGLVVCLDTGMLRTRGGSWTNAQATPDEDRAVTGIHDFLVVMVDDGAQQVLALPLFPRSAPGSAPLDDRLRAGSAEWLAHPVFYSRWQHWKIPFDALVSASLAEDSAVGARRRYATDDASERQALANWATRNRCSYRTV